MQSYLHLCTRRRPDDSITRHLLMDKAYPDYCALLIISHNRLTPPLVSFAFSWRWYLKWWLGPFGEICTFPGDLPCIQKICLLLTFCLLNSCYSIFYYRVCWGLNQETGREKKTFSSPTTVITYMCYELIFYNFPQFQLRMKIMLKNISCF